VYSHALSGEAIALTLVGRGNRFIISSHEIQQVQKPPSALGFGLILFFCPLSH
jgi:hypothetical protein